MNKIPPPNRQEMEMKYLELADACGKSANVYDKFTMCMNFYAWLKTTASNFKNSQAPKKIAEN